MKTTLIARYASLVTAMALASASAMAAVTVTDITARQRWPWNGLVDIDFTISGAAAGEVFAIDIDATAAGGATSLSAKTYTEEPIVGVGQNRVVWDLGADYPGFRANDFRVSVTATPISESRPLYLKIDLSGGPNATKYPVTYTFTGPAHVMGAQNEPCQTTELWLRRIKPHPTAISFHRWSYSSTAPNSFYGKMTKDYYLGVFELTQRQYELVMGSNPSYFTNQTCYASRPVENVVASRDLYGRNLNIHLHPEHLSASSFFGRIRARTGLPLAVPSSMQAEWALRGGYYTGEYYRYKIYDDAGTFYVPSYIETSRCSSNSNSSSANRDSDTSSGTAAVGSYLPNMFGLYDTMGNVYELTCEYVLDFNHKEMSEDLAVLRAAAEDETLGTTAANPVTDYVGQDLTSNSYRAMGGCYSKNATIWNEGWFSSEQGTWNNNSTVGLRISMTVE